MCNTLSFNLDIFAPPINLFEESIIFTEGYDFINDALTEATTGTTKGNVLKRLWEFIKKIFKWMKDRLSKLISWVKKLFRSGVTTTVDEIADEVIGSSNAKSNEEILQFVDHGTNNSTNNSISKKSITVNIPSNEFSTMKMEPSVEVLISDILVSINKEKQGFTINIDRDKVLDAQRSRQYQGIVPGKTNGSFHVANIIALCKDKHLRDLLLRPSITLANISNAPAGEDMTGELYKTGSQLQEFDKAMEGLYIDLANTSVTIDELEALQSVVNDIFDNLNKIVDIDKITANTLLDQRDKNAFITSINNLGNFSSNIQMGLNAFTNAIMSSFNISAKWLDTIKTKEKLSEFVDKMIKNNIGAKFIARNVYLACDKSLKGSNADLEHPIFGQSRLVLFPDSDKNIVHKVALSKWGVNGNMNEKYISDTLLKADPRSNKLIAKTIEIIGSGSVTSSERVVPVKPSQNEIAKTAEKLSNIIDNKKLNIAIGDLHDGNVGKRQNGQVVLMDYGWRLMNHNLFAS